MALGSTPSVGGARERLSALGRTTLYTIGCLFGGATLAVTLSAVGSFPFPREVWLGAAAVAGAAFLLITLTSKSDAPRRCWQVPKSWWRRWGSGAFIPAGATLTVGLFTPIIFPTFYVFLLLIAALEPPAAVAVGCFYGVCRSFSNWTAAFGHPALGIRDPHRIFVARRNKHARLTSYVLVLVVIAAPLLLVFQS